MWLGKSLSILGLSHQPCCMVPTSHHSKADLITAPGHDPPRCSDAPGIVRSSTLPVGTRTNPGLLWALGSVPSNPAWNALPGLGHCPHRLHWSDLSRYSRGPSVCLCLSLSSWLLWPVTSELPEPPASTFPTWGSHQAPRGFPDSLCHGLEGHPGHRVRWL